MEIAPGFEFGDAVGVPTAAEEVDDEGAEGEEVGGVDGLVGADVFEGEGGGLGSDFQGGSSMPVSKRSAVAFSETARRSGWTRARVFWVMRSSWSCRDSFVLVDMAPPSPENVQSPRIRDFSFGLRRKNCWVNVAVRPKPDWCDGWVYYIGDVKAGPGGKWLVE